jgi:hypothetical protein
MNELKRGIKLVIAIGDLIIKFCHFLVEVQSDLWLEDPENMVLL